MSSLASNYYIEMLKILPAAATISFSYLANKISHNIVNADAVFAPSGENQETNQEGR